MQVLALLSDLEPSTAFEFNPSSRPPPHSPGLAMWSILSIAPLFVALARDRLVACHQPAVATGDQTDICGLATALPLSVAEAALHTRSP